MQVHYLTFYMTGSKNLVYILTDLRCVISITTPERTLTVGCVIPIHVASDDFRYFAKVTLIAVCGLKLFVVASLLDTKYFDDHYHAFVVETTAHNVIIEDIKHCGEFFEQLYMYKKRNCHYVSPRSAFFTDADQ